MPERFIRTSSNISSIIIIIRRPCPNVFKPRRVVSSCVSCLCPDECLYRMRRKALLGPMGICPEKPQNWSANQRARAHFCTRWGKGHPSCHLFPSPSSAALDALMQVRLDLAQERTEYRQPFVAALPMTSVWKLFVQKSLQIFHGNPRIIALGRIENDESRARRGRTLLEPHQSETAGATNSSDCPYEDGQEEKIFHSACAPVENPPSLVVGPHRHLDFASIQSRQPRNGPNLTGTQIVHFQIGFRSSPPLALSCCHVSRSALIDAEAHPLRLDDSQCESSDTGGSYIGCRLSHVLSALHSAIVRSSSQGKAHWPDNVSSPQVLSTSCQSSYVRRPAGLSEVVQVAAQEAALLAMSIRAVYRSNRLFHVSGPFLI